MGAVAVDTSQYPLVKVTFDGKITEDDFDRYLATMSRLIQRRRKNVVVFDALRANSPSATQRSKQADWLKVNSEALKQYSCGSVFVIQSPLVRGALTAILWVAPVPGGHTVVATLAEAEEWALGRLRAAGVVLAPAGPP